MDAAMPASGWERWGKSQAMLTAETAQTQQMNANQPDRGKGWKRKRWMKVDHDLVERRGGKPRDEE